MNERVFRQLRQKFDPNKKLALSLTSQDPELGAYLRAVGARGSTALDISGKITVQIDDALNVPDVVWYEEFAHALQLLRGDDIQLSCDDPHSRGKEAEIAACLIGRTQRRNAMKIHPDMLEEYREKASWGTVQ